jgi:hypothetical protein
MGSGFDLWDQASFMGSAILWIKETKFNEQTIKQHFENTKEKFFKVSYILSQLELNLSYNESIISNIYLFRLIKGINNYESLKKYLTENELEAFEIGIYKDENNILKIPPKRTYNYYLKEKLDRNELNKIAEKILSLASQNKILLDLEIVKKVIKEKKKSNEKEIRESIKLVKKLVYPLIDLKIKNNGKFTTKDLLDVLVHVALTHDFTNNGSSTFSEINPDFKAPSGDLMMYHFSKFNSIDKLRKMFEKILDVIFNFAKRNYNLLQFRKLNIAYDIHNIPYYGEKTDSYVCGDKPERGTSDFFKFLTCSVVVAGQRFILDVIPMPPAYPIEKLIEESIIRVKSKIHINRAYLDRGFDKPRVINVLKNHKVNFIMPKIRSDTVLAWFDKSDGCPSRIIHDFIIGQKNKDIAIINLILVDDEVGIKRAFITNFDIAPCIAYRLYEWYGKRWGIETGYRNLDHDFKPRTTTKNYHIRLFYFLFSCCLYNLWVLVNICVSMTVYGRIKDKPIIPAKMFAVILYRVQLDYYDGG